MLVLCRSLFRRTLPEAVSGNSATTTRSEHTGTVGPAQQPSQQHLEP